MSFFRKVKFIGQTKEQMNWGNNNDATEKLLWGATYDLEKEEVHGSYTQYKLRDIPGLFNSVCFEEVE
jgi:hypothetical protein